MEKNKKKRSAFDEIAFMLQYKERTESEVKAKLHDKGYTEEETDEAIEKAKSYSWIDDSKYSEHVINNAARGIIKGKRAIEYNLKKKGIDEETLNNAVSEISGQAELDKAIQVAKGILSRNKDTDIYKLKDKIFRGLAMRGFEYEVITEAVRYVINDEDN